MTPNPGIDRMKTPKLRWMACVAVLALAGLPFFTGCDEGNESDDEPNGRIQETPVATATTDAGKKESKPVAESKAESEAGVAIVSSMGHNPATRDYNASTNIGAIVWKGKNVSAWPVTTTLCASITGGMVKLSYGKARNWPAVNGSCANAWAIVNIDGTWYAGTFETLRPGQTEKHAYTLDGSRGDYFHAQPLSSWRPRSGEVFGLMVSGLCRDADKNVQERSNICMVRWP